jgi:shikimate kinase
MAAGKTTLGKLLATQLAYSFIDSDDVIERMEGKSVAKIIQEHSWDYFRQKESDWLSLVSAESSFVCAVGGGLPCHNNNLEALLKIGLVIYLECSPTVLYARLLDQKHDRPLISAVPNEELVETITNLLNEREIFYQKADHVINGDLPIEEQANQLIRKIKGS